MNISRKIKFITTILITGMVSMSSFGQDDNTAIQNVMISVPEVALLDLESASGTTIQLSPEAPQEAGMAVDFSDQTNTGIWINYSSIVNSRTEPGRNITVQITSGSVPQGMVLNVAAGQDAGLGDGRMGKSTGSIQLTNKAQNIITGVGSAYTGNGVAKGHQLTYALSLDNVKGAYASLDFNQSNTVAITYTLTDQ